jgi:hypothetical protein
LKLKTKEDSLMKLEFNFMRRMVVVAVIIAAASSLASAQLSSNTQTIALSATLAESLTVSLSASSVNFNLSAGSATNAGSTGVTATTTWVLRPSRNALAVYAYFGSATAALTDGGGNNIPSSAFFIANNGGASTAVNQAFAGFGAAGSALRLANVTITNANRAGNRTDAMLYNINLTTLPQLPAGTYTGTLNIQAQATP